MPNDLHYDVIVLGAGVAGLSLASELSPYLKVLVLERETHLPIRKFWLTNHKSVELNPELRPFIDSNYTQMDIIAYDLSAFRCHGSFYLWDTRKLTEYFVNKINGAGGKIMFDCTFYSYQNSHHGDLPPKNWSS